MRADEYYGTKVPIKVHTQFGGDINELQKN